MGLYNSSKKATKEVTKTKTTGKQLVKRGKEYTVKDRWNDKVKAIAVMVKKDRILFIDSSEFDPKSREQEGAFWVNRSDIIKACNYCGGDK